MAVAFLYATLGVTVQQYQQLSVMKVNPIQDI